MIRAGELTQRITIQRDSGTVKDSYNQTIPAWTDVATVWAGVITTGGREFFAAQRLNAETSAVFKIRYRTGLDTEKRILWGDRVFGVININDVDARHVEMLISAKEVV
jgi:SPP1 family predicted phage head-tail adaptor